MTIKNVSNQPDKELCNLPTPDSYEYVMSWQKKYPQIRNEITVSRLELRLLQEKKWNND
jgi:hypothetical protein